MNKKLQIFISSTFTDLVEERQTAVEAILDAGHIPAGMELFKAGKSQMKTIRKWIDESDVYMLILGGRYGSIEEESGLSYTELEYKYALSKNMPVFAIVLDDSFLFTKAASKRGNTIFEKDNMDKYESFKKFVKTNIVKFISNTDQLFSSIHSHLNEIINDPDYNLVGWIRADNSNNIIFSAIDNSLFSPNNNSNELSEDEYNKLVILLKNQTYTYTTFFSLITHTVNALNYFISKYDRLCERIDRYNLSNIDLKILLFLSTYDIVRGEETDFEITTRGIRFYSMLQNHNLLL